MAEPLRLTLAGDPVALCVMAIEAVRLPVAPGAKVRARVHELPALKAVPLTQLLPPATVNSAAWVPEVTMLLRVKVAEPVLVMLVLLLAVLPTVMLPKFSALLPIENVGACPVPDKLTVRARPLPVKVKVALRAPVLLGAKRTVRVQVPPALMVPDRPAVPPALQLVLDTKK